MQEMMIITLDMLELVLQNCPCQSVWIYSISIFLLRKWLSQLSRYHKDKFVQAKWAKRFSFFVLVWNVKYTLVPLNFACLEFSLIFFPLIFASFAEKYCFLEFLPSFEDIRVQKICHANFYSSRFWYIWRQKLLIFLWRY